MSKVKIEGNPSGSGTLTIAAPNTDTDSTLNLPDGAGEVVVTDGTTLVVDNANDKVGIGTSSPDSLLSVALPSATGTYFEGGGTGSSSELRRLLITASTTTSAGDTHTLNAESANGNIAFATTSTERMRIDSSGDLLVGASSATNPLGYGRIVNIAGFAPALVLSEDTGTDFTIGVNSNSLRFYDESDERMRIDANGNLLVGTTASPTSYSGGATFYASSYGRRILYLSHTNTSNRSLIVFGANGSSAGAINCTPTTTTYGTSSDYRLKEDWQPMSGSIDRVKALNPVNFAWISSGERVDGFLAHEAQEVVPEAVTGTKDAMTTEEYEVTPAVLDDDGNVVTEAVMGEREVPDYQGIDQSKLVPLLTAALQEAIAKIEDLETRLAAVEGAE